MEKHKHARRLRLPSPRLCGGFWWLFIDGIGDEDACHSQVMGSVQPCAMVLMESVASGAGQIGVAGVRLPPHTGQVIALSYRRHSPLEKLALDYHQLPPLCPCHKSV